MQRALKRALVPLQHVEEVHTSVGGNCRGTLEDRVFRPGFQRDKAGKRAKQRGCVEERERGRVHIPSVREPPSLYLIPDYSVYSDALFDHLLLILFVCQSTREEPLFFQYPTHTLSLS